MASVNMFSITAVMLLLAVVTLTEGGVLKLDEDNSLTLKPEEDSFDNFYHQFKELIKTSPTVGHFAVHTLCKHRRRQFELAMANTLTSMKESFVKQFVTNLCEKTPRNMLKLWVAELFDTDKDGYIDFHEEHVVTDINYDD